MGVLDFGNVSKNRVGQNNVVEEAWSAAILILRKNGYTCTAAFMECSLKNVNYNEGGLVAIDGSGLFNKTLDTYDFNYNKYKATLVNLVNNAAWLSQNMNVLHKINVKISTVFK